MKTKTKIAILGILAAISSLQASMPFNGTETFSSSGGTAADYTGWGNVLSPAGASQTVSSGSLSIVNPLNSSYYYNNTLSGAPDVNGSGLQSFQVAADFTFNPAASITGNSLFGIVLGQNGAYTTGDNFNRLLIQGAYSGGSTYTVQFLYQGFVNNVSTFSLTPASSFSGGTLFANLTTGHQYSLIGDYNYDAGNNWILTASLRDTSTGLLVNDNNLGTMSVTMSTEPLYSDAYLAILGRNLSSGGNLLVDNILAVSPVPEPSSIALAMLGGVGMFMRYRKKQ